MDGGYVLYFFSRQQVTSCSIRARLGCFSVAEVEEERKKEERKEKKGKTERS
jgi:hypothetical protein